MSKYYHLIYYSKGINLYFFVRLAKALIGELLLIFSMDSKFLDSPLNTEGIEQGLELRRFLFSGIHPESKNKNDPLKRDMFEILRGEKESSVIVTSTLRRAISTTTIALWDRVNKTGEKVHLLSSLQEISRNVDTRALSSANEIADLPFSRIIGHCTPEVGAFNPDTIFDTSGNYGNKTRSFYGIKRLKSFNDWIFQRDESVIIAGGHSLWFKNFFQTYLPHKTAHDAKFKKITNSGAVSFTIYRGEDADGLALYRIDPDSIEVLYGGFTTK
jgi:hypothetical protein